jgi:hypothetical protein
MPLVHGSASISNAPAPHLPRHDKAQGVAWDLLPLPMNLGSWSIVNA